MTDDLQNLLAGMVKRMKFVEARNSMWNGPDGYQIGWNHDDRYRVKLDGKVILKEIVGFDRAIAWANEHRVARILAALNLDAVLALVAAAYAGALSSIAALPRPDTEDQSRGHENAYRAIEALAQSDPFATAALARMMADARADEREKAALVAIRETEAEGQRNIKDQWRAEIGADIAAAIRAMKGDQG